MWPPAPLSSNRTILMTGHLLQLLNPQTRGECHNVNDAVGFTLTVVYTVKTAHLELPALYFLYQSISFFSFPQGLSGHVPLPSKSVKYFSSLPCRFLMPMWAPVGRVDREGMETLNSMGHIGYIYLMKQVKLNSIT